MPWLNGRLGEDLLSNTASLLGQWFAKAALISCSYRPDRVPSWPQCWLRGTFQVHALRTLLLIPSSPLWYLFWNLILNSLIIRKTLLFGDGKCMPWIPSTPVAAMRLLPGCCLAEASGPWLHSPRGHPGSPTSSQHWSRTQNPSVTPHGVHTVWNYVLPPAGSSAFWT